MWIDICFSLGGFTDLYAFVSMFSNVCVVGSLIVSGGQGLASLHLSKQGCPSLSPEFLSFSIQTPPRTLNRNPSLLRVPQMFEEVGGARLVRLSVVSSWPMSGNFSLQAGSYSGLLRSHCKLHREVLL